MAKIDDYADIIAALNKESFGLSDPYSNASFLRQVLGTGELKHIFIRGKDEKIVGYLLYRVKPAHIESVRRGVTRSERRKGYGTLATRGLIKIARKLGKQILTFVATSNLAALNGNIKEGFLIERVDSDWVYISYTPPPPKH